MDLQKEKLRRKKKNGKKFDEKELMLVDYKMECNLLMRSSALQRRNFCE